MTLFPDSVAPFKKKASVLLCIVLHNHTQSTVSGDYM